jgi:uncharacterized protein (TIGR00725 family)
MLLLDRENGLLFDKHDRLFVPQERSWEKMGKPRAAEPIEPAAAVRWLQEAPHRRCRIPIGVVGPREPSDAQEAAAEQVGAVIARLGLTLLCGGRGGVMAAACRGAEGAGGLTSGLLPGDDPAEANAHVAVPIATGLGVGRNYVIARAALCLVAVGGGYGTISEIAFALQFGKRVFGLAGAPEVAGVAHLAGVAAAERGIARVVLCLPAEKD